MKYLPKNFEKKWQDKWEKDSIYTTPQSSNLPKKYILDMFPYPSGEGLHVGHFKIYTASDILARYHRAKKFNVLHPMGWDAFGLPAENYAIKTGIHPKITTAKNIQAIKLQMQMAGYSYDWSREIDTTDSQYYKWTQWIFVKLFEKGLAYEAEIPINWCPKDKTGLANEEVVGGKCDRCGTAVERKIVRQWVLKITEYSERLLADLEGLDWPEAIKEMQINWIGKSQGTKVKFGVLAKDIKQNRHSELVSESSNVSMNTNPGRSRNEFGMTKESILKTDLDSIRTDDYIECFTTRVDTIFGVTALVLAPEHPKVQKLITPEQKARVEDYIKQSSSKSDLERTELNKEKTGVFIGSFAINPLNNEKIPIWIADYVLGFYGSGAVMFVPAHDERDFEFAKKYSLPIKRVIFDSSKPIRSYLMGAKDISTKDLEDLNIKILETKEDGHRILEIPEKSLPDYEKLIVEKLDPGFWNEYIGNQAAFIFKHKDGKVERLVLSSQTEELIDKLAAEFNNQNRGRESVWKWLAEASTYTDLIVHTNYGELVDSGEFSGLSSEEAKTKITAKLKSLGKGEFKVQYKLRDWVFSRQRYWGEPIPVIHCKKCGIVAVPEKDLPVTLPEVEKFEPTGTGESPLAGLSGWVNTTCPKCGSEAKRETNTMPQWAGSCWYYLRFCDPTNDQSLIAKDLESYWLPVDWYIGGAEHAVLHLLYARFWHKFLYDLGVVTTKEPFQKLSSVGLVLGPDGQKMSKSRGNVVRPESIIEEYGADTLRLYEAFMGPFENAIAWDPGSINGVYRFLTRVWEMILKQPPVLSSQFSETNKQITEKPNTDNRQPKTDNFIDFALNRLIQKVANDIKLMKFNTAVASMMEFINLAYHKPLSIEQKQTFLILLAPFAPHITEELWEKLGGKTSIHKESWPEYNQKLVETEKVNLTIQVNGKVRDILSLNSEEAGDQKAVEKLALASQKVQKYLEGKSPKKIIFIPSKALSIVI